MIAYMNSQHERYFHPAPTHHRYHYQYEKQRSEKRGEGKSRTSDVLGSACDLTISTAKTGDEARTHSVIQTVPHQRWVIDVDLDAHCRVNHGGTARVGGVGRREE